MEHFRFTGRGQALDYTSRRGGGGDKSRKPRANPAAHGQPFLTKLTMLEEEAPKEAVIEADYYDGTKGRILHFNIDYAFAGADPQFDEFGGGSKGIEVVSIKPLGDKKFQVTLFVPFEATYILVQQIKEFVETKGKKAKRWASVESVERVAVRSLYRDDPTYFPSSDEECKWFEIWIVRSRSSSLEIICEKNGIELSQERLQFYDRIVVLARLSPKQLVDSHLVNIVAEICKPTFSITWLHGATGADQIGLIENAVQRIIQPNRHIRAALLDSGVQQGHPLIKPVLNLEDVHDTFGGIGTDVQNHGTGIASLILYGEHIERHIEGNESIEASAGLESVRLLNKANSATHDQDPKLLGSLTAKACYLLPVLRDNNEQRVYISTITDSRRSTSGAPNSYSATLDSLAYGASPISENVDEHGPKLMIQSAGNSKVGSERQHVEIPAQAWNVVTVGAYTKRPTLRDPNKRYFSAHETLSPSSSHSTGYDSRRALKPDFVMEGGNAEHCDLFEYRETPECMVLGASSRFPQEYFTLLNGTSASAGLAGNLASKIWAKYPFLKPNSVRALLINSAKWTSQMLLDFRPNEKLEGYEALVQQCGMGVPNPYLATDSEQNFVSMIFEDQFAPFVSGGKRGEQKVDQFQLVSLPWPSDLLETYRGSKAELRVTLSYFIEPNPSNRDYAARYLYESHGFRFRVKSHKESEEAFCARISKEFETEENLRRIENGEKAKRNPTDGWMIGPKLRSRGSVHSDIWNGDATKLAKMDQLAIFPVAGWWRYLNDENEHGKLVDYSIALSLTILNENDAKLYSAVKQIVDAEQSTKISIDA